MKYLNNLKISIFRYDDNKKNTYAYVYPSFVSLFNNKLYLCDEFFAADNIGKDTKSGTLVHEATHKTLNTNDYAYGNSVEQLPNNLKIKNADSWEYFYERLYTKGK